MRILSIETSCDDTGVAILEVSKTGSFHVPSNIVSSQIKIHKKYGGVFPAMAKREHQRNLLPTFYKALKESKLLKIANSKFLISNKNTSSKFKNIEKILEREPELLKKLIPFLEKYSKPDIDIIAVTNGPGLEPCLWVGVNFAKALSQFWNIPAIPVNHIESHILINFLDPSTSLGARKIKFPAVSLVVSGGHTQLILMKGIGKYTILGETRDDAAGECFDKCAKLLGLEYPGGPVISKLAEGTKKNSDIKLPRPMINTKDYDFSFSGLKTAVLYAVKKHKSLFQSSQELWNKYNKNFVAEMATEVQQAIIDVLLKKTLKAVKDFNAKSLILGGGVSANSELRSQFKLKVKSEKLKVKVFVPEPHLSTDNALMIAVCAFYHQNQTKDWQQIEADGNLRVGK